MKPLSQSLLAVAALALVAASPAPAVAQPAAAAATTTRSQVTIVRIKPDMLNEWIDLQRNEVVPALKKAGVQSRTVWATAVGNSFEYTIVVPFEKWAAMDSPGPLVAALGAEAAARLNAKTRKCIEVSRTFMSNRIDDLNIPAGNALVMRSAVRRAAPGKMQEYLSHQRADILPVMKKAKADGKIAGAGVSTRGVGAGADEVVVTTYYNKFADMDTTPAGPLAQVLGAEAAAKINAKGAGLSTPVQVIIRRRMADLSY